MIEQNGSGLRVSGSMLIADAPALLTAGRGFLRTLPTGGDEVVFDLAAVTEADQIARSLTHGADVVQHHGVDIEFVTGAVEQDDRLTSRAHQAPHDLVLACRCYDQAVYHPIEQ